MYRQACGAEAAFGLVFWLFPLSARSEWCCGVASLDEFPDTAQPYPQKRLPSGDFHHRLCGT